MSDPQPDLIERLLDEFVQRLRRGEAPSIAAYEAAHPECAAQIRQFFPAAQAMQQIAWRRKGANGLRTSAAGIPERLGDYHIIRQIGSGGMGIVYEAQQASLSRHVAVKVLPPAALQHPTTLQRFHREAQTAARLHHTNIVPVFGVGEDQGFHYIVMQLIQGVGIDKILARLASVDGGDGPANSAPSLAGSMASGVETDETFAVARALVRGEFPREGSTAGSSAKLAGDVAAPSAASPSDETRAFPLRNSRPPLPTPGPATKRPSAKPVPPPIDAGPLTLGPNYWRSVAQIGLQAAGALQYAHQRRTLHRDIKPSNLLIDQQGVVWISDFGLAKAMEDDGLSRTGDILGTLRYMAPERFLGRADARSDVYSLGLTLYELLALRPAYDDSRPGVLMQKITAEPPICPRALEPRIPRDLEVIVLKAAAREPEQRYPSAEALADDLQRFLDNRPILARHASLIERLGHWARRNPAVASLSGLAVALLILAAVVAGAGYVRTQLAHRQTREALAREEQQRQKAETLSGMTLQALDEIFEQYVPNRVGGLSEWAIDDRKGSAIRLPAQPVVSKSVAALLERMLAFYERLSEQNVADAELRRKVADANRRVGDIHRRLGHLEPAQAAYRKAIEGYRQLQREAADDTMAATEIARIHNELGELHWAARWPGEVGLFHASALEILEAAQAATPQYRFELARTYYFLGRGRPPEAAPGREPPVGPPGSSQPDPGRTERETRLRRAIGILERLAEECPSVANYRHLLACCYRDLPASPPQSSKQPSFASADKAIEILQRLVAEFPDIPDYRFDLSRTYAKVDFSDESLRADRYANLEKSLRHSLSISEKLVAENPHVPEYAASRVHGLYKLTELLRRSDRPEDAERPLRQALALQTSLVKQYPTVVSYVIWRAIVQESLAKLLFDRDRMDEARSLLTPAVADLEQLRQRQPQDTYVQEILGRCYKNLSDVLRQLGDPRQADEMLRRGGKLRIDRPRP